VTPVVALSGRDMLIGCSTVAAHCTIYIFGSENFLARAARCTLLPSGAWHLSGAMFDSCGGLGLIPVEAKVVRHVLPVVLLDALGLSGGRVSSCTALELSSAAGCCRDLPL